MCATCGCSSAEHEHEHGHGHGHEHGHGHHSHHHHDPVGRVVQLEQDLLQKNGELAATVRQRLRERQLVAVNFVSSPGSGKTTLLERTVKERGAGSEIVVIQGDQATQRDAERLRRCGAHTVQINTGTGCHLDAAMVARALEELSPSEGTLVAIENVGNLVCPALFDLGEHARAAVLSVTEGEDKPMKYPYIFRDASLVVLNKIDLLPHLEFDMELFEESLRSVNPRCPCLHVSATTGAGMSAFYSWLRALSAPL